MKRLLHIILFFIPITIFSQPYITVDETTYTNEQLVTDVLVGSTCAAVDNITSSTGTDFSSLNGIGYFENTNPNFPISDGIILMTGNVMEAPGPNGSPQANGGWPGDAQIENYLNAIIPPSTYLDASILEFDFTPVTDSISFNFVFASNEYGTFQCDYSDAFAFFLEDIDTGVVTNLALVPDTPGEVPISVTTIRDQAHNGTCASANPEYFSTYYGATGLPNVQAPINFNGHTVLMQAWSYVVPNSTYRMKLVIVDRLDSAFNSAVFIQGGSFFLGSVDLGVDLTIANGNARCDGEIYTIDTQLGDVPPGTTFLWEYEDPLGSGIFVPFVPSEESSILNVTDTGNYRVTVNYAGVCESQGELFVEFDMPFPVNDTPSPLILCDDDNNGFGMFTLSD
ncbi:MAG: choice-of-anchor L domain-containing protein, partial [Flavobacteriaceae bacterium]